MNKIPIDRIEGSFFTNDLMCHIEYLSIYHAQSSIPLRDAILIQKGIKDRGHLQDLLALCFVLVLLNKH